MPKADPPQTIDADVCAYGATPAGIAAAIQATRMGRSAVLVEFGRHVGGMTASGLSATDGGRSAKGIADEFYRTVGARGFRPATAEKQFRTMLAAAGSSTTANSSTRLRRRKRPDIVFVEFSYNDAVDRFKLPVDKAASNLATIVHGILSQDPSTAMVLQVMNVGWDAPNGNRSFSVRPELEKYNDNYRTFAREHGLPLLDHYANWIRLKENNPQKFQELVPDGSHPSKEGSLAVTWPTVKAWLENARTESEAVR